MSEISAAPIEDVVHAAAEAIRQAEQDDGVVTLSSDAARAIFPVLNSLAGIFRAHRSGELTEPMGLLGPRTRVLAEAILKNETWRHSAVADNT